MSLVVIVCGTGRHCRTPYLCVVICYAHDTWSRNQAPLTNSIFSGAIFWHVYHANLASVSSGIRIWRRLEHQPISSHKLACTWLKWWILRFRRPIIQLLSLQLRIVHISITVYHVCVYFRCRKFSFHTHMEWKIGARNLASVKGASFWTACHGS